MIEKIPMTGWRWRVAHLVLYLVKDDDGTYWACHVPLGDSGGSIIDFDSYFVPGDGSPEGPRYTRQQVIDVSRALGHSDEQIEAALFLADIEDLTDHHDLAQMGDEDYERVLKNAKRRLGNRRKYVPKVKNETAPNP